MLVSHLNVNYQKPDKESMKLIIRNIKLNILPAQNESGGYIEMDYYIFEQEIIFILSRAEYVQNKNFWKQ